MPGFVAPRFTAGYVPERNAWAVVDATVAAPVWGMRGAHAGTAAASLAKFLNAAVGPEHRKGPNTWEIRATLAPFCTPGIDLG